MPWEYKTSTTYAPLENWPQELDSYGEEGWELVSTFVVERGVRQSKGYALAMAVFKRRVPEPYIGELADAIATAHEAKREEAQDNG